MHWSTESQVRRRSFEFFVFEFFCFLYRIFEFEQSGCWCAFRSGEEASKEIEEIKTIQEARLRRGFLILKIFNFIVQLW